MAISFSSRGTVLITICILLLVLPSPVAGFGAGNIPSISLVEGNNWRHGDIEDMLKTIAFLKGKRWSTMMIKRVYFGNWLRDYSQAIDVGSLKGIPAPTIRILVWILCFLSFGYATAEFEVTEERLGVYRPEEHIDNPKDYADNQDARKYDPRLRGPVQPAELAVDPNTGMKNYIANENGGWATSTGYVKHSLSRSIHFGRVYTHGAGGSSGSEVDLCEALRCLGQALHCCEDFSAHSNYCELALRELGFHDVFTHTGRGSQISTHGHRVFPLVTGTFGTVDFLHSVLGEATDHFTQTEVEELDLALKKAGEQSGNEDRRGLQNFIGLVAQIPGVGGGFADQARTLQAQSAAQQHENDKMGASAVQTSVLGVQDPSVLGVDPVKVAAKIYPILEFRDRIVKAINSIIAKIPGLEALVEKISDALTLFILSLLAPFVRPIICKASELLKMGSSRVIQSSQDQQFSPWNDPYCTDPTHSMLSKDHFSNVLNPCAGRVAATVLQYIVPRVLYAWDHPGVPLDEVMNDILRIFHHPAIRDERVEIQRNMFNTVRKWAEENPERGNLNYLLSSSSVKAGLNHRPETADTRQSHSLFRGLGEDESGKGEAWTNIICRDLEEMKKNDRNPVSNYVSPSGPPPRAGSPASPCKTSDFGYDSSQFPAPQPFGGSSLQPDGPQMYPAYQQGSPPVSYQSYHPHATYQAPAPAPHGQQPPGGFKPQGGPGYSNQPPYSSPSHGSSPNRYP